MNFRNVVIRSFGYKLPPNVVTSEAIEERLVPFYRALHLQKGQLAAITGIKERREWEDGYTLSAAAAYAARLAILRAKIDPALIGGLVYGGVSREENEPATAIHVAAALEEMGIKISPNAEIFDISNACLGAMNGLLEMARRIESGEIAAALVVSAESSREILREAIKRMNSEPSLELFRYGLATLTGGSGAIAMVLTAKNLAEGEGHALFGSVLRTQPKEHLLCRWGMEPVSSDEAPLFRPFMRTDSVAVLEHGVELGRATFEQFCREQELLPRAIDRTICHQVGSAHRDTIMKTLGLKPENDFVAYDYLGNTGTVALPLAAALAAERGFLQKGQKVLFMGIGSGLNCLMIGVDW